MSEESANVEVPTNTAAPAAASADSDLLSLVHAATAESEATAAASEERAPADGTSGDQVGAAQPAVLPTMEMNGESIVLQQGQDPETGEVIFFFQDENGQHIAVTPDCLPSLGLQVAPAGDEMAAASQADAAQVAVASEAGDAAKDQLVAVSLDSLNNLAQLAESSMSLPTAVADTNVVQSVDTPKMSVPFDTPKLTTVSTPAACAATAENGPQELDRADDAAATASESVAATELRSTIEATQPVVSADAVQNSQADIASQPAVVQVGNGNGASIEDLVANAIVSGGETPNFVIMTDDGNAEINLADLVTAGAASGQTLLIETPDGYVPYTGPQTGGQATALQLVDDSPEAIMLAAASGQITDGQLIQTTSNGQTVTYAVQSTESGIELVPVTGISHAKAASPKKAAARNVRARATASSVTGEKTLLSNANNMQGTKPTVLISSKVPPSPAKKKTVTIKQGGSISAQPEPSSVTVTRISPAKSSSLSSLGTPSTGETSAIIATAPGPSQLASSRRTYSKKNIVWLNPQGEQPSPDKQRDSAPVSQTSTIAVTQTVKPVTDCRPIVDKPAEGAVKKSNILPSAKAASKNTPKTPAPRSVSPVKPQPIITVANVSTPQLKVGLPPIGKSKPITAVVTGKANAIEEVKKPAATEVNGTDAPPVAKESAPVSRGNIKRTVPITKQVEKEKPIEVKPIERDTAKDGGQQKSESAEKSAVKAASPEKAAPADSAPSPGRRRGRKSSVQRADEPATAELAKNEESKAVVAEKSAAEVKPDTESKRTPARRGRSAIKAEETPAAEAPDTRAKSPVKAKAAAQEKTPEPPVSRRSTRGSTKETVTENDKVEEQKEVKAEAEKPVRESRKRKSEEAAPATQEATKAPENADDQPQTPKRGRGRAAKKSDDTTEKTVDEPQPAAEEKPVRGRRSARIESSASVASESTDAAASAGRKRVGFKLAEDTPETDSKRKRNVRLPVTPAPVAARSSRGSDIKITPILKTPKSDHTSPARNQSYSSTPQTPILRSFSETDPEAEFRELQLSVTSLKESRTPTEFFDYTNAECSFHVRTQSAPTFTPRGASGSYACQKCGYRTTRMNNLVWHHKDQCPVVKNQVMLSWENEIKKQTKAAKNDTATPIMPARRKLSDVSSPEEDEADSVPLSRQPEPEKAPEPTPTLTPTAPKVDASEKPEHLPLFGSDDDDEITIADNKMRKKFGFAQEDIVWLEWHNMHWPAIVVKVHETEKMVSVKLIEAPPRSREQ